MASFNLANEAANYTEHLKLVVGIERKTYVVHKEFILPHSPVLTEHYEKGCEFFEIDTITIPNVNDYDSMQVLLNWCYKPDTALVQPAVNPNTGGDMANNKRRSQLLQVYALAREFGIVKLKDQITNQFREHSEPRLMTIALINDSTTFNDPECGLARYVIDNVARYMNKYPKKYHDQQSTWSRQLKAMFRANAAFLQVVHDAQMRLAAEQIPPRSKPLCYYHDHMADEECSNAAAESEDENTDDESMDESMDESVDEEHLANTSKKKTR